MKLLEILWASATLRRNLSFPRILSGKRPLSDRTAEESSWKISLMRFLTKFSRLLKQFDIMAAAVLSYRGDKYRSLFLVL